MKIGIVTTWFERGAAYVSRQFRDILLERHEVFVFARGGEVSGRGDPRWDDRRITWGIRRDTPLVTTYIDKAEFEQWVKGTGVEVVIFNEQRWFQPLVWCKRLGVKTIAYIDYYNERTLPLFDIYDALICNTKRHYSAFEWHPGVKYIPWGTDISLFRPAKLSNGLVNGDCVTFFHSAGFNGVRKGTDILLKAFVLSKNKSKLLIHTQTPIEYLVPDLIGEVKGLIESGRLEVKEETVPAPGLFYKGDVYVYPTRLEGIGLTMAEALSSGLPIIVPDNPPMNEFGDATCAWYLEVERLYARSDGYYWPQCVCSVEKLSKLLDYLAINSELVVQGKMNARKYACKFLNQNKNFRGIVELVENVAFRPASQETIININRFDNREMKRFNKLLVWTPVYWLCSFISKNVLKKNIFFN